jgi:hypothetical protein
MCVNELLNLSIKTLSISGLILDMFGVYKLFNLEPPPLEDADQVVFENVFPSYSKIEEIEKITKEINKNIFYLKTDIKELRIKSKKWFILIALGFLLQCLSVFLSFFL